MATIAVAIKESLSAGRIERKVSRLAKILEGESDPGRRSALRTQKLKLEAALFSKEAIPMGHTWLVVLVLAFPMARFFASTDPDPTIYFKILILVSLAVVSYAIVYQVTFDLLRRKIAEVSYLSGQNPYFPLENDSHFRIPANRLGLLYNCLVAFNLWLILFTILNATWNEWTSRELLSHLSFMVAVNTSAYLVLPKEIENLMGKLATEYAKEWDAEYFS
ncbi:hypothetical protein M3G47_04165 [Corynebacterium sanguinis]|uniref:hypothetical protein n=1 Tax=Corynebacterium sanguinis TaxID=2594913 RepID=UPI0021A53B33|nr:hypothetical protein [Corynebacterium sanguinis]MCT1411010.1 hypothetical protein [Corynebacterium sanguinis]MCT1492349.1 hypothetical protein [Corynebacterium sanguinis]MCT2247286.1 hypothetical protein [Corynebacterium sanguinis]